METVLISYSITIVKKQMHIYFSKRHNRMLIFTRLNSIFFVSSNDRHVSPWMSQNDFDEFIQQMCGNSLTSQLAFITSLRLTHFYVKITTNAVVMWLYEVNEADLVKKGRNSDTPHLSKRCVI